MTDHDLNTLKDAPLPPARDAAKTRAVAAAMVAFDTAAVVPPKSTTARPFMVRHGYKIAASLLAACVIGPLLLSLPSRNENPQIASEAPPAAMIAKAPDVAPQQQQLKVAPPANLATLPAPAGAPPTQPTAPAASPAPTPPAAAGSTSFGRDTTNSQTRFGLSGAAKAPDAAQQKTPEAPSATAPAAKAARAPPPETRFSIVARVDTTARDRLRAEIEAGRIPKPDQISAFDLVNGFDYDPAPIPQPYPVAVTVTLVAAPWRPTRKLAHIRFSGTPPLAPLVETASVVIKSANIAGVRTLGSRSQSGSAPLDQAGQQLGAARSTLATVLDLQPTEPATPGRLLALISIGPFSLSDRRVGARGVPITLDRELPSLVAAPADVRFAIAVVRFAELLTGAADNPAAFGFDATIELADGARGADQAGERATFVALMRKAKDLRR